MNKDLCRIPYVVVCHSQELPSLVGFFNAVKFVHLVSFTADVTLPVWVKYLWDIWHSRWVRYISLSSMLFGQTFKGGSAGKIRPADHIDCQRRLPRAQAAKRSKGHRQQLGAGYSWAAALPCISVTGEAILASNLIGLSNLT